MTPDPVDIMAKGLAHPHPDWERWVSEATLAHKALIAAGYRIAGPDEVVVPRSHLQGIERYALRICNSGGFAAQNAEGIKKICRLIQDDGETNHDS